MLNLPLKKHWFQKIASNQKTIEYRQASKYWQTRLSKLSPGDPISLSLGYTKKRIYRQIIKIELLPSGLNTDLKKDTPVYAIHLRYSRALAVATLYKSTSY